MSVQIHAVEHTRVVVDVPGSLDELLEAAGEYISRFNDLMEKLNSGGAISSREELADHVMGFMNLKSDVEKKIDSIPSFQTDAKKGLEDLKGAIENILNQFMSAM